jgi:hypothetical protein
MISKTIGFRGTLFSDTPMFFVSHIFFIMPGGTASTGAVGDAQATTVERTTYVGSTGDSQNGPRFLAQFSSFLPRFIYKNIYIYIHNISLFGN